MAFRVRSILARAKAADGAVRSRTRSGSITNQPRSLWTILEPSIVEQAVQATLARRGTVMPTGIPVGLSDQFASDKSRVALWDAFVGRNKLNAESLADTVIYLRERFAFTFN